MNRIYQTGYQLPLYNSDKPELRIMFSEKQEYFDDKIYPIDKFDKYIARFNQIKNKLESHEKLAEAIEVVYPYHNLKKQFPSDTIVDPDVYKFVFNKKYKPISRKGAEKILFYDFFYSSTITLMEYFLNFPLLNEKSNILLLTLTNGYLEAVAFYLQKYLHSNNFKKIEVIVPAYIVGEKFNFNLLKGVIELFGLNYVILNKPLNNNTINSILDSGKKYDFILLDPHINDPELAYFRDQLNHTFMISQICIGLSALKKGGNLLFVIPNVTTKVTAQIVYFLTSLFENKYIYHTETTTGSYHSYAIVCLGFKGIIQQDLEKIFNLNEELYKIDSSGFKNYNILDESIRKKYNITKEITSSTQRKFLTNFADYKDSEFDRTIFKFNLHYLRGFKQLLDGLDEYMENKKNQKYLDYMFNHSLMESVSFANKIDLDIKPGILSDFKSSKFYKKLIYSMFNYDNTIYFEFRKSENVDFVLDPHKQKINENLRKYAIEFILASQIIDTRDPDKYDYVKKYIRYYEKTLGDTLAEKYNISIKKRRVSRAWLKFIEILTDTPVVDFKTSAIKSFHICEAPGTFIMSLKYFLEKRNVTLDWTAQSLKGGKIFDDYGMIKENPNRWDFGSSGTGDITDPENIKYYANKYNNIKLVTADCGTSWAEHDLTSKLKYCMITLILGVLGTGGNFVFKSLMPVNEPIIISLYYMIYCRFKKLIFFKPMQNPWSPEFYVIGIDYRKKLNTNEFNILLEYVDNYNPKISLVKEDDDYHKFIIQLGYITNKLKNNFRLAILRNIFYVDNWEKLSKQEKEEIKKNIKEKNQDWINRFIIDK